ncbi:MAG: spermidine/putrescine ABC transporter substrate-binding protein [Ilumatobacteraceae bacterium]
MRLKRPTRILMSRNTAELISERLSRRDFLAAAGGSAALAAFLAACGRGGSSNSAGDFTRKLNLYTWAEYDDPDVIASWGDLNITIFNSNEEAIQKLVSAGGVSGFDIVVPTGPYIPQMVAEGLLEEIDLGRIPNFGNLDAPYIDQVFDPGNKYSVCKNWGTTGWVYDTEVVTTDIQTWADFIKVAQTEASGQVSVIDTPPNLCGIYFWANGIDWNTESAADLDACEKFLVDDLAQHIKAFDSYPGINLTQGNYVLSQVWNGDARQGLISVEDAGDDPTRYKWAVGAPQTELWMDNWCIAKGASNLDAAYDFINFILDPVNSLTDVQFHGFNTGLKGIEESAVDMPYKEMVFFTGEVVDRMRSQTLNSSQDRLVDIYNKTRAKAGA